jgi:hypothetical protein
MSRMRRMPKRYADRAPPILQRRLVGRKQLCVEASATAFCGHYAEHGDGDRASTFSGRQAGLLMNPPFPPAPLESRHKTFDPQHSHRVFSGPFPFA